MIVKRRGLHLMQEKAFLGASSDGLVTCTSVDTCCLGCLEINKIKCAYSIDKNVTVEMTPTVIADKFGDKFFLKRGKDGELNLRQEHHYTLDELGITGREWCDFVVYSNGEVVVDRILTDFRPVARKFRGGFF